MSAASGSDLLVSWMGKGSLLQQVNEQEHGMSERSEVQNLTESTVATEPLDASPPAADAGQVGQGEPKDYPEDVKDGEPYATGEGPAS